MVGAGGLRPGLLLLAAHSHQIKLTSKCTAPRLTLHRIDLALECRPSSSEREYNRAAWREVRRRRKEDAKPPLGPAVRLNRRQNNSTHDSSAFTPNSTRLGLAILRSGSLPLLGRTHISHCHSHFPALPVLRLPFADWTT